MRKIEDYSLYVVISEEYGMGKGAVEIARSAIAGGADIIQMREKHKPRRELAALAGALAALCREKGVTFIVNDDPLLAGESGADGVHLGQEDLRAHSVADTRRFLGNGKIIGVSTHSLAELVRAGEEDVDYIAFGPIFPTRTKDYCIGTRDVREALTAAKKPVFLIGGIALSNVDGLLEDGAKNIAVIRDILQADNSETRARDLRNKLARKKEAARMVIRINGKDEVVEKTVNLAGLVARKKLPPETIVIEHNRCIVPRDEWEKAAVRENDIVEIVSFVGGG